MALTMKKGDMVLLHAFTGMKLGPKEVIAADKTTITIDTERRGEITFSRKTGKQIDPEPKEPRYASFITEDDGSFVPPNRKKKKPAAKPKKKPEDDEDFDEEDFEEEEPEEKPKKKPAKSKSTSKKKPESEEDDEDWEDNFEDIEEVED